MDEPRGGIVTIPRTDPLVIISKAIESGMDPDKLGKLMDLSERWNADRAAEAYANALTAFSRDCPIIERVKPGGTTKDDTGKAGKPAYYYAPFEHMMGIVGPIMVRHGIVATFTFGEPNDKGYMTCTCRIRVGTHHEETTVTAPSPGGNRLVNPTQVMGQLLSYLKRYSLSAALNVVCKDEDKDAAGCLDTIDLPEIKELDRLITEKKANLELFLQYASDVAGVKVSQLSEIPVKSYPTVLDTLKKKTAGKAPSVAKEAAK